MNLYRIILLIALVTAYKSIYAQNKYCEHYEANCNAVGDFVQEYDFKIRQAAKNAKADPIFFIAIVAPEIANYSAIQNEVEYRMMEVFYVNWGEKYANFSIGHFQMKPIFARQIENEVASKSFLSAFRSKFEYKGKDETAIRKERVERLNSVDWQLAYLTIYYLLVEQRFKALSFTSLSDRLSFYAAAYNCGYTHSVSHIKEWMGVAWFPNYGKPPAFKYANVAVDLWNRLKD